MTRLMLAILLVLAPCALAQDKQDKLSPVGTSVITTSWSSAKGEHKVETIVGGSNKKSVEQHEALVEEFQKKFPKIAMRLRRPRGVVS